MPLEQSDIGGQLGQLPRNLTTPYSPESTMVQPSRPYTREKIKPRQGEAAFEQDACLSRRELQSQTERKQLWQASECVLSGSHLDGSKLRGDRYMY